MSAVAALTRPTDARRPLARQYRRLLGVPVGQRVAVGLLGPLVAAAVCLVAGFPPVAGSLVWLLAAAVVSDLLWRRIFNWITGPVLLAVVAVQLIGFVAPAVPAHAALPHWTTSLAGFGLCLGLMLFLHFAFGGGEGDVKLIGVLGAVVGPWAGVEAVVTGYLLAAGVALGILAFRVARRLATGRQSTTEFTAGTLPMAPFFALGILLSPPHLGGV